MQCAKCWREIDPHKGYFTANIASIRYDFHIACKPIFTFNRVQDEETYADKKPS